MPVQITIIGLGQIGASIGMALEPQTSLLYRVGHDKDLATARRAEKLGAVDAVKLNLPASIREARIVVLSLPLHEIRKTLEVIGQDLPEGAVVMDTAPLKAPVVGWVEEYLPADRYYVGLAPALNPGYLHRMEMGLEAARADLFEGGVVALSAMPGAPEEAVKLATDLVTLLGATPLFADMLESDGLMTSTHLLPQFLAASLLKTLVGQPGWDDARKLAGRPFATLTSALAHQDEMEALSEAACLNQEGLARVLDLAIASMQTLRDEVANGDRDRLQEQLELALDGRERWYSERTRADWSKRERPDMSEIPNLAERLFGSRKYLNKKK